MQEIDTKHSFATCLVNELKKRNLSMVTAESCTGGRISSEITAIPGSSEVFWGGIVSYSNMAKTNLLGVKDDTIAQYGAVSEETVREMVHGALRISGASIGIAISGVAGPSGGSPEKPVGTVWLAVARNLNETSTRLLELSGDRLTIMNESVQKSLIFILEILKTDT